MTLLTDLTDSGLEVYPYPGWETRTNKGRDRVETVGILNHWDAITGWPGHSKYLSSNRFGGNLYHIVIKASGRLNLYSQRYAWHAGGGDSHILRIAQQGGPIPDDSPRRIDDHNGNPHFFGVCINYHPNQGPIPTPQYDALVRTNAVLLRRFNLNIGQIARHMDWTHDKRDIDTIDLATFRSNISRLVSGGDLMQFFIDALKRLDTEFFTNLQAKTGEPHGDPGYWGRDEASDEEWRNWAPVAFSAVIQAAGMPGGGVSEFRVKELIEADMTHLRSGQPIVARNT